MQNTLQVFDLIKIREPWYFKNVQLFNNENIKHKIIFRFLANEYTFYRIHNNFKILEINLN